MWSKTVLSYNAHSKSVTTAKIYIEIRISRLLGVNCITTYNNRTIAVKLIIQ